MSLDGEDQVRVQVERVRFAAEFVQADHALVVGTERPGLNAERPRIAGVLTFATAGARA